MASAKVTLEIHVEDFYHAVRDRFYWPGFIWPQTLQTCQRLLTILTQSGVCATWYILGDVAQKAPQLVKDLQANGQAIGSHGHWHQHGEREGDASDQLARKVLPACVGYRSPFWDTTPRPGMAGGTFFRTLPYRWLKWEITRHGVLYLHPHDFSPSWTLWRRRLMFCNPWQRLERLLMEVDFERR